MVSYDPEADISILQVPELPAEPLKFAEKSAAPGTDALVLGFPGGGDFAATPARIRETIELNGPDIYRSTTVIRKVYTIRGVVKQGNSGGPLINRGGEVLGVVFGAAVDDNDTGFVLTADEVSRQMARVGSTERVATGILRALAAYVPQPLTWPRNRDRCPLACVGIFFVAEMPGAGKRYEATVGRVVPGALDGRGQHVGVGLAAHVQEWNADRPVHRTHEPAALAAKLAADRPALVLQGAVRHARNLEGPSHVADGLREVFGGKPFTGRPTAHQSLELVGVMSGQVALGPDRHLVGQQRGQQCAALVSTGQRRPSQRGGMR